MRIKFLEVARMELDEAVEYYNAEMQGLGEAFLAEVISALERIGSLSESLASLLEEDETLSDAQISVWSHLPDQTRRDPGGRCSEPAPQAGILARSVGMRPMMMERHGKS